jgi:hypothetical protein
MRSQAGAPLGYTAAAVGLGEFPYQSSISYKYTLSPISGPEGERLVIGGRFVRAGGLRAVRAASFDGEAFTPMSMASASTSGMIHGAVQVDIDGQMRIVAAIPNDSVGPVAYWDGSQWVRLLQQPGTSIHSVAAYNGELLALMSTGLWVYRGGSWTQVVNATITASVVGNFGQGEKFYFSGVGDSGTGVYVFDGQVVDFLAATPNVAVAMAVHDDGAGPRLYVGGIGGSQIARFNGSEFEELPGGGLSSVYLHLSLASWNDGLGPALYAAGSFTWAGSSDRPNNGVARWRNGVWEPVTAYFDNPATSQDNLPRASLAVFQGKLYIAGEFTSIGRVNADHFAVIEACPFSCTSDYNRDGDFGTDQDIEAFFRCLAGHCCATCTSDFNNDGDFGTDQDIESFFRVLAGGVC